VLLVKKRISVIFDLKLIIKEICAISAEKYVEIVNLIINYRKDDMMMYESKLYKMFKKHLTQNSERVAIIINDVQTTYKELFERINAWKNFFESVGVNKGDRLIISTDHRLEFIASWLSLWSIGAIPIPMEPVARAPELTRAIEAGKPHLICSENREHLNALPKNSEIFNCNLQPSWVIAKINTDNDIDSGKDSAFFAYTSGTTGAPKCVIYDIEGTVAILESLIKAFKLTPEDVFMTPLNPSLPSVIFTAILPSLAAGSTLVLLDEPIPRRALKVMAQTGTTVFFAVPYFYRLMNETMSVKAVQRFEHLRLCVSTSAFLDNHTFNEFYKYTGVPIRSIFCSSEAFYCTFYGGDDIEILRKSCGTTLEGVKIKVADKEDNEVPLLTEGQILVSGTHKSKGYFCRPELEEKVFKNGWVHTGDLGYLDEEGYLYITGRISHTINVGGHLVNPQEVESILISYPGISEAMILGEKDPMIGERVIAKVVLKEGAEIEEKEVIEFCKKMLLKYKVPERIEIVESLPKSRYGKIRRM